MAKIPFLYTRFLVFVVAVGFPFKSFSVESHASIANPSLQRPMKSGDHPSVFESGSEENDYKLALAYLERTMRGGKKPLDLREFRRMNWIGRTAILNYVCSVRAADECQSFLHLGLADGALYVRDHALRMVLASVHFSIDEKNRISRDVVTDNRNYRRGGGLWIVDRARNFLARR